MNDSPAPPDETQRRAIFAELIAKQDRGYSVAASRALMCKVHGLDLGTVRAIEDEGVEKDWPPLGE